MAATTRSVASMDHAHGTSASRAEHRHRRLQRLRIAASIALVEGVVVGFLSAAARWVVVALAVVSVALYLTHGRKTRGSTRDVLWIAAFSQTLAVIVAVLAFFFSWIAYALAAVLAVVVIVLLLVDR
jgi:hypothetical protein